MRKITIAIAILSVMMVVNVKSQVEFRFDYVNSGQIVNEYDTLWDIFVNIKVSELSNLTRCELELSSSDSTFESVSRIIKEGGVIQSTADVGVYGQDVRIKFYAILPIREYKWKLRGLKQDGSEYEYEQ